MIQVSQMGHVERIAMEEQALQPCLVSMEASILHTLR